MGYVSWKKLSQNLTFSDISHGSLGWRVGQFLLFHVESRGVTRGTQSAGIWLQLEVQLVSTGISLAHQLGAAGGAAGWPGLSLHVGPPHSLSQLMLRGMVAGS